MSMRIAILPLGFLILFVVSFVVVLAVMSTRNRGALVVLCAALGFGAVLLAGGSLFFGVYAVRSASLVGTDHATISVPPPREVPPSIQVQVERTVAQAADRADSPGPSAVQSTNQAPEPTPKAEAEGPGENTSTASPARRPRPGWMDEPLGKSADGAYRERVLIGPHRTRRDCDEEQAAELRDAVNGYIDRSLGEKGAGELVALSMPEIHERIVKGEWEEPTVYSFGDGVNLYNLLVYDAAVKTMIEDRYQQARVAGRLTSTGLGAGLLLGFLGTVFGYLKLDTVTRGYYTRRLQLAAASVILAEAAIVALWAQGKIGF